MSLHVDYRPYRAAYIGPRYNPKKRKQHPLDRTEYNGMKHDYPRPHYRREMLPVQESPIKGEVIKRIIASVAYAYGYTPKEILSHARDSRIVVARFAAIWAVHQRFPEMRMARVGKNFCRDRTSIINALQRARGMTESKTMPDPMPKLFPHNPPLP